MLYKKFQLMVQVVGCVTIGLLAVWGLLGLLGGASPTWAAIGQAAPLLAPQDIPLTVNYQGFLRNPDGKLTTATYTITARIYDLASGPATPLYTTTVPNVTVRDGLFNIVLGDDPALDPGVFDDVPRYIGISLNSDPELIPRQRLHAVPWAYTANTLVSNATVDGITSTGDIVVQSAQLEVNGDAVVGGNLSVDADITSSGAFTSGGDISWGGHLNNMNVTDEYQASCWRWSGTTCSAGMTPISNSICFLTQVDFEEGARDKSTRRCEIVQEGGNWQLYARSYIPSDPYERHTLCIARCLQW